MRVCVDRVGVPGGNYRAKRVEMRPKRDVGCSQRRIDADGCSRWGSDSHPRLSLRLRPAWIFLWHRCYVYSFIDLPLSSFPALVFPQHAPTGSAASSSVGFASLSSWLLSSLPSGPFPASSPHPSSAQINYLEAHLIFVTYTHLHAHADARRNGSQTTSGEPNLVLTEQSGLANIRHA